MYGPLVEVLKYYKESVRRLFDLDKYYQKKNIWRKEQVRKICLNLEIEGQMFTPLQILFFEFILALHTSSIHNYIIKNQRSQQIYSNTPSINLESTNNYQEDPTTGLTHLTTEPHSRDSLQIEGNSQCE